MGMEGLWACPDSYAHFCAVELADGGAGLICFGNIPVHRQNLENYNNAILDRDNPWDAVAAFSAPVKAAKSRGGLCMPQLTFPGRQVPDYFNPNPKSSSDVQLEPSLQKTYGKPTPLTIAQIKDLISRFVWAAETLAKAGADGIVVRVVGHRF
jgi:2,4-dienoyl-CoA reductase-like NADH-dependent reductase (Old Yellow Enzyme family)